MTKVAVVPAAGIGDALIFHMASHHLQKRGWEVVTFSPHLMGFGKWLKGYRFTKLIPEETFSSFDCVILQHDNTAQAQKIGELDRPIYRFYGTYRPSKHGDLREPFDFVCNPKCTMVDNLVFALSRWFGIAATKENGLNPPIELVHRKYPRRLAIHPSSSKEEKNWPREKFEKVAAYFKRKNYEPVFLLSSTGTPLFSTLEEMTSFLYESGAFLGNDSGPGHIASYLNIPSLIIGRSKQEMSLWEPGWYSAIVVTPPSWTAHWRWTRTHWKRFVTPRNVVNILKKNVLERM